MKHLEQAIERQDDGDGPQHLNGRKDVEMRRAITIYVVLALSFVLGSRVEAAIAGPGDTSTRHTLEGVVANALVERVGLDVFEVTVEAYPGKRGYVRLTGAVDTAGQRHRSLDAALDVRGVVAVIDQIFVVDFVPLPSKPVGFGARR